MCGIAGILLHPTAEWPDLAARLVAMRDAMTARGPDDAGLWLAQASAARGPQGLATRRLAIRDLSPAGHMPMTTADGQITITYNGEIYNADALRQELLGLGHVFRSTSDTEVILAGYAAWGREVVARLRGMFAFAILDLRPRAAFPAGSALLARDHLGVKPLYTAWTGEALLLASELRAILAAGAGLGAISAAGLVAYLLLGSVPPPWTIYAGVQNFPAAHLAEIDLRRPGEWAPVPYWRLPATPVAAPPRARAAVVAEVRAALLEAVRVRLVSDVPLGAFLSGGLDSSAVVALMRQATSGPLRTCAMIFEEAAYSEAPYAQAVAEAVGAEHYARVITAQEMAREFEAILASLDQPSLDGVNTYFVAQTARQAGLTVALSGLGGDELFGGYTNTFGQAPQVARALGWAHAVPGGATLARLALRALPPARAAAWSRVAAALAYPPGPAAAYFTRRGLLAPAAVAGLLAPDLWDAGRRAFDPVAHIAQAAAPAEATPSYHWISRAELRTYTQHQLLRDTDAMSMAHSLEVREPLLDRVLVETVLGLPVAQLTDPAGSSPRPKPLLLDAVGDLLPPLVRERRDKQGFTFPLALWLKGPLAAQTQAALDVVQATGWLRPGAAQGLYGEYAAGRVHWSRVWAVVALAAAVRGGRG